MLRPFGEVVKYARLVNQQAAAYPYSIADENMFRNPMAVSAQSLLKEGERALRRLTPLIENPSSHLSQHLRTLMLNNEEMGGKIRAINVLLYDFEDYIEPETYDQSKFLQLETATRDLALSLVEHITTFTTQSALDPLPASKFPALPPLPPLPPGAAANMPRPDSRMTTTTSRSANARSNASQPHMLQRRPSQSARSDGREEYSRHQFQPQSSTYSPDSISPVSPTAASPMPFSSHMTGEQDRMRNEHWQRTHRSRPSNNALPMLMDRMDIGIVTPPSSVVPSQPSPYYQGQSLPKGRGSSGYPYHDTPPASETAESHGYPFPPEPPGTRLYMSPPASNDNGSVLANEYPPQRHFDNRSEGSGELLQRESLATQTYSFSERSDGSHEPLYTNSHNNRASVSSGTVRTGGSANSIHQSPRKLTGNEIGSQSSINALGGFCKGARLFASAGPGRAIKRVGAMEGQGGGGPGSKSQEFSQGDLFGSMLGATGAETSSDPTAQCQSCTYKALYSNLRQDIEQDPLATQQARGISYRSRFLWKSHVAVKGLDVFYGCLFCDKAKATCHDGDATVFQSIDLLMRHISRHPLPLPAVPGVAVLYANDPASNGRQDYDLLFQSSQQSVPYTGIPASEIDRIASLPAAIAIKDNIRRRDERPQAKPDSDSEVLSFLSGARILGVEYPDKWEGKWCQGWHEGSFGVFSSKIITLEMPHLINTATLPKTLRTGVARWKFEAKSRKDSGWLNFSKGETIYNLAWDDTHAWFWSGSTSKGQCGIFPKSHISIGSVEDGSLGPTSRDSKPKEKSRFGIFGRR